ncbi:uncharacterized protein LOC116010805 [Ipomoea triloba]|uniref:uncharacterized protein LOC116010805 n=1 Tax=Ipomoea triloba TaxID=35885 RepID=UPI00125DCEC8|nr:uncharacterized protein LOC116010805 [Ipomoea triloba]
MVIMVAKLAFSNHFLVDPIGFAGILLLVWKQGLIDLKVINHSYQVIHAKVIYGTESCFASFAYVRPNLMAKTRFWEDCKWFTDVCDGLWIFLGDLNDIANVDEQWGSEVVNSNTTRKFLESYSECGLIDPGASSPFFTWCRHVGNRVVQRCRLDRVLWNVETQINFLEAKVIVLPRLHSYHHPILFMSMTGPPPPRDSRPFRFEAVWISRDDYGELCKASLRNYGGTFLEFIKDIIAKSHHWNWNVFGNIFKTKRHLEARIRGLQQLSNYPSSEGVLNLERRLISGLNNVLDQEETLWFHKARI